MLFVIGEKYTKKDIYTIFNVPSIQQKGNWDTGYNKFGGYIFIFCNIGIAGRAGQNHNNEWDGDKLAWFAKSNSAINQPLMKDFLSNNYPILIFTRTDNKMPFTYEGQGHIDQIFDSKPIKIIWNFSRSFYKELPFPDQIVVMEDQVLYEGAKKEIIVNKYERNITARRICLDHYGYYCQACNFNFFKAYGSIGKEFIHVHHLKSIASIGSEYIIDPLQDLIPVCPNCHAIIHIKNPFYTIEEIRNILKFNKQE